ncbi:hypothetical protein [Cohaesibacter intestini]|uniref:hypothetical protein n=1 Tax=Cohaesibacter intestini TaxID=2211145 RepID=UPI000DE9FB4C|nr:hypothetical protein [Cohaesibacter intestini]
MNDAIVPQITLDDSIRLGSSEKVEGSEQTCKPDTCSTTINDWISGPTPFIPIIIISEENLFDVKMCNDAAIKHLQTALSLINTLDQSSLGSISKEITMMAEVVTEKRLFNEQYRRSVERLRENLRSIANPDQKDVLDKISKRLGEALAQSDQIDYALCPLNNSERLYSLDHFEMIDCILQNM